MHPLMHLINGKQSVQKAIGVSVYTNIQAYVNLHFISTLQPPEKAARKRELAKGGRQRMTDYK